MGTVARDVEFGQPVPLDFGSPPPPPRRSRWRLATVLRFTLLTVVAILFIAPFVYMVSASLLPLQRMFRYPPQWLPFPGATLENYTGFLTAERPLGRWVFNSVYVTVTVTVLQLFFSSLVAYTFAKRTFPGRDALFFLGLSTMMLPTEVTLIPNYLILSHIPLFGGNDITGAGGHGWLDSYWGLIAPNLVSAFSIFIVNSG